MDCVTRANILEMTCYWQPLNFLDMDCITGAINLRNEMLLATAEHFGHGLHNTSKCLRNEMLLATAEYFGLGLHNTSKCLRNEMLLATAEHFGHGLHNTSK